MEINTKYSNGDKVWLIRQTSKNEWVLCTFCGGIGKVSGLDGREGSCPECYGRKGKSKYIKQEWQVVEHLTIGQAGVKIRGKSEGVWGHSEFSNMGPQEYEREEEYMCIETGIGSGNVYKVDLLYPLESLAQIECDRRNKEEDNTPT